MTNNALSAKRTTVVLVATAWLLCGILVAIGLAHPDITTLWFKQLVRLASASFVCFWLANLELAALRELAFGTAIGTAETRMVRGFRALAASTAALQQANAPTRPDREHWDIYQLLNGSQEFVQRVHYYGSVGPAVEKVTATGRLATVVHMGPGSLPRPGNSPASRAP